MKKNTLSGFLVFVATLLCTQMSLAQSAKRNGERNSPLIKPKVGQNQLLQKRQILPPNRTNNRELKPLDLDIPPPPNTRIFYGACNQAFVTKLSYQFLCWDYNRGTLMPDQRATFVLRRDGTEPDWAMNSDDYAMVNDLFKNKQHTGFQFDGISGWTSEYDEEGEPIYIRGMPVTIFLLYTVQEQQAPVKYCSVNPKQYAVVAREPGTPYYGSFLCFDLMAISYFNGFHDSTGDFRGYRDSDGELKGVERPYKPGGYLPYSQRLQ